MKFLALAATGTVIVGLAACSHAAPPHAVSASHPTVIAPVSCGQQYATWENGNGKGVIATLKAVSSASTVGDTRALTVALKKAEPAVARGARYPLPACADPRGYWNVLLMHVTAAIGSKGSSLSVHAALEDVPKIEQNLTTELKQFAR